MGTARTVSQSPTSCAQHPAEQHHPHTSETCALSCYSWPGRSKGNIEAEISCPKEALLLPWRLRLRGRPPCCDCSWTATRKSSARVLCQWSFDRAVFEPLRGPTIAAILFLPEAQALTRQSVRIMKFFLPWLLGLCAREADAASNRPLILVPGLTGSPLQVQEHEAVMPHMWCKRNTGVDWMQVWVSPAPGLQSVFPFLYSCRWRVCRGLKESVTFD